MKSIIYAGILLIIPLGVFLNSVAKSIDYWKIPLMHNSSSCERVNIEMPTEDLIEFGKFLIGATSDSISMYYKHQSAGQAPPGYLISIDPSTKEVVRIPTHNFPSQYQMNAHGITLFNNKTLYVLSHSYDKGGEIVFLFNLEIKNGHVEATFFKPIKISEEHGIYNGIAIVSNQYFYITQWMPFADSEQGRDMSMPTSLYRTGLSLYTKTNSVKLCMVLVDTAICSPKAYGHMPNGIVLHDKLLFVADSLEKIVLIYHIDENLELTKIASVPISHALDNLHYKNGIVYVTGIASLMDYLKYSATIREGKTPHFVPGGFSKVYKEGVTWKSKEVLMQDKLSLPSSSVVLEKKVVISSVIDSALLFCPLVK